MTMPFAQQALLWGLGCFALIVTLYLACKPKRPEELGETDDLDTHIDLSHPLGDEPRRVGKHPFGDAGYRNGPTLRYGEPHYPNPREVAEHHVRNRVRDNWPTKQIILTPRHLEHINIRRRGDGKPPMNAAGFRAAIAEQARTGINPIRPTDDWLAYLIAFELFDPDHQSHRVAVDTTIAIEPDAPFNGQFGGAGATGSFDPPGDPYADLGKAATRGMAYGSAAGLAAALGAGAALAGAMPGPDVADASKGDSAPQIDDQPQADPPDAPDAGGID